MGPAMVALTKQNREQAKRTAQDLGAQFGQLQSGLGSSDDDASVPEKQQSPAHVHKIDVQSQQQVDQPVLPGHWHEDFFGLDLLGFLDPVINAGDRYHFSNDSLDMVELFAGVGTFGTGWRRLSNVVIGVCEWNETLTGLLLERNPMTVMGTSFNQIHFLAWRSLFDQRNQRVHCSAEGPECTPFSIVGKEGGSGDARANQITGMADASRALGSCVCIIENVPNIEEHDFAAGIQYVRSKDYQYANNPYVEHVINGGSTIRKRVFPTFEDDHMAAVLPPVGITNTRLPFYEGAVFAPEHTPVCGGHLFGNHDVLAKDGKDPVQKAPDILFLI